MQQPTATANSTISDAEVGRRLANGEQGQELAKELGADKIILYTKEDYTKIPEKFDIILACS